MTHPPSPIVEAPTRPFGLTRCTTPTPMSARDGQALIDQPLLDTAVQCSVTTTEDMQAWTDQVTDG